MTITKKNRILAELARDSVDNDRVLSVVDYIAGTLADSDITNLITSVKIVPRLRTELESITVLFTFSDADSTRTAFLTINSALTNAMSGPEATAELRAVTVDEAVNMYEDGKAMINAEISYTGDRMMTVGTIIDALKDILINQENPWVALGVDDEEEEEEEDDDE